jgi:pimeloyl-ACP methyl ester carboxylesterase
MSSPNPDVVAGYVTLDTASISRIHLLTAGPERSPGQPAIIVIAGLGADCLGYVAVLRHLASAGIRSYAYDRPGIGRSPARRAPASGVVQGQDDPIPAPAAQLAQELQDLLTKAAIPGPYVLVAHSYGGIIAREFIGDGTRDDVIGLVLVDANCQHAVERGVGPEAQELLVTAEIDYWEEVGLNASHKLTAEEWAEVTGRADPPSGFEKGQGGGAAEFGGYVDSCHGLSRLQQYERHVFGNRPVSVIKGMTARDLQKLLAVADEKGKGREELRTALHKTLETLDEKETLLQKGQLQLSEESCGKFVVANESGHNIQFTEPEVIASEVKWVIHQVRQQGHLEP